jgi:succinyl-diaminopimelate desuccinylase
MVVELAKELIACPSVTPDDAGCFAIIESRLKTAKFTVERFDIGGVSNLFAYHGLGSPVTVLNGHVDVVPTGPVEAWQSPPFAPEIRDGRLYGRGSCDMKGSVAAMTVAMENIARAGHKGTICLLLTSDEEGDAVNGTQYALAELIKKGWKFDNAFVGEPTSEGVFGDVVKIGRRGSLSGSFTFEGKQGHVAYPQNARNPIHQALPFLNELVQTKWDDATEFFGESTLQISNILAGTGAGNVIPGEMKVDFNIRYAPNLSATSLQDRIESMFERHKLRGRWTWNNSALPFLTDSKSLQKAIFDSVHEVTGIGPQLGTGGGTSDARFFAAARIPVVEFGPCNATIHAVNESVGIEELEKMVLVVESLLRRVS